MNLPLLAFWAGVLVGILATCGVVVVLGGWWLRHDTP